MPRRRAGSPPTPPNPTRRRQISTPISNLEPAMEIDASLLQQRGEDGGPISTRSPAAIALAAAGAYRAAPIALVSNSYARLFPETELSDEEELQHSVVPSPQEAVPQPPPFPVRHTIIPMRVDEKGKEPEEASKQICGICLSEEQRATLQGLLNCCSHYFCFTCILEWSKAESRCPVCKRRFNTITVADEGSGLRNTAIRVENRDQVYQPSEEEMNPYENAICIECNQSGEDNLMLQCDVCDSSAHTFCVGLGREVPEGSWYCGGCRSTVEGPSYAQTQDRVVHRGESNMNTAAASSSSFGRYSTLDRRRVLNRRIRILLRRPRPVTNALQNSVENFREVANAKDQLIPFVKKSIKHICAHSPLDESAFMNVARRATNTILALSGIAHNSDRVVATPFRFPWPCRHACDGREPDFLMRTVCSPCFESFVGRVVGHIATNAWQNGENFREVANAKDQLIPIVKKSIKHICVQSPLDESAFMNVARRATHTILALRGITHNRDRVVATPFPFPWHCRHACDGREPAFLMTTVCSPCLESFVGRVVGHIANMFS